MPSNILQTPFYNVYICNVYISKKSKTHPQKELLFFFFNQVVEYLMKESTLQLVTNVETWCKPASHVRVPPREMLQLLTWDRLR